MVNELKRALCKKSNVIFIALILFMMFSNAYYSGWNTALHAKLSEEFKNIEDVMFFKNYYGNTIRVWKSAYTMIQALAPILLVAPYILSYTNEKNNKFRNLVVIRSGVKKYRIQKMLAIAISGVLLLSFSELLFMGITYFLTYHDMNLEFIQGLMTFQEKLFLQHPFEYYFMILCFRFLYYFCFTIFAVGITSMLKNKIAVFITPFIIVGVLDMVLPITFQPNVIMQPMSSSYFSIFGYLCLIGFYVMIGVLLYLVSEKRYAKQGN